MKQNRLEVKVPVSLNFHTFQKIRDRVSWIQLFNNNNLNIDEKMLIQKTLYF